MKVSVVIATCDRKELIRRCLKSLEKQTCKPDEVIIVDSSTNDLREVISREYPQTEILFLPKEYGLCRAYNLGFSKAKYGYVMIADDDSVFPKNWIETILDEFKKEPKKTAVITSIVKQKIGEQEDFTIIGKNAGYVACFFGAGSVFRKDVLDKVGYYYEPFIRYSQESDLSARIIAAGYKIKRTSKIFVYHLTVGTAMSKERFFYYVRNRFWFFRRGYFDKLNTLTFILAYFVYFFYESLRHGFVITFFHGFLDGIKNIHTSTTGVVKAKEFYDEYNIFKYIKEFLMIGF